MRAVLGLAAGLLVGALVVQAAESWTLERALEQALTNNPDARIAQQRIMAAQAGVEQANSAFWPRLQVQSSYTRTQYQHLGRCDTSCCRHEHREKLREGICSGEHGFITVHRCHG